jgi:hypothetical protein
LRIVAERAILARGATEVLGRPQQLRVGIADIFVSDQTRGDLGQQSVTNQTELNNRADCGTGAKTFFH